MNRRNIKPIRLTIRCFAERKGDQWQGFTLEFGLAAQGDSLPEVKKKLDGMIQTYLYDALVGEDREHAEELLTRRAAGWVYATYYFGIYVGRFMSFIHRSMNLVTFRESLRLAPPLCRE